MALWPWLSGIFARALDSRFPSWCCYWFKICSNPLDTQVSSKISIVVASFCYVCLLFSQVMLLNLHTRCAVLVAHVSVSRAQTWWLAVSPIFGLSPCLKWVRPFP